MMIAKDTVVSFYKFVTLENPKEIREILRKKTFEFALKGTILLAPEGINAMISGTNENIDKFKNFISTISVFNDIEFKLSYYDKITFRRMLVKVKKEIITMRKDLDPLVETGKYINPLELKKLLDKAADITVLDTRNDYEFAMGSFKQAIDPKIKSFSDFALYIDKNIAELQKKTVVTFCTGGIRCEKATAYMMKKGINSVYQLKGGILNYFKETNKLADTNHWRGDCVVFDKRKAVTPELAISKKLICYMCLYKITAETKINKFGPGGEVCKTCYDKLKESKKQNFKHLG